MPINFADHHRITTPFKRARQAWDLRIGHGRVQAKNWRLIAIITACSNIILIIGMVILTTRSYIHPYVVEVDKTGSVRAAGIVTTIEYDPPQAAVKHFLASFVTNIRSVPNDPVLLRKQWLTAYHFVTSKGRNYLTNFAQEMDPFTVQQQQWISVDVTSVTQVSDTTYQIEWRETMTSKEGVSAATARYTGMFAVMFHTPKTEEEIRINPLGLYITTFYWSKKL